MQDKTAYYFAPIAKLVLFVLLCFVCMVPFSLIGNFSFLPLAPSKLLADISNELALILAILGALMMLFRLLPNLDFYAVFVRKEHLLKGFLKGTGLGVVFMLVSAAVLYIGGYVEFSIKSMAISSVLLYLVFFLLISIFEELLFRTYPLFVFTERYPVWLAILVNGLLFGLAHIGNDDFTTLAMANITLAGILFCVYTLQKQNIAWVLGLHFSWNFTQGIILGYNVSGNEMPGVLKAIPIGENYLSGGKFGVEGSVVCTVLLVIWIIWRIYKFGLGNDEVVGFNAEGNN
ncbi:MAG: type II CAAX endopeptidase family protein [Pedobacter sp.]|uniref:CPBP family intramembrane glutamic endopeptidase n=1 Tax=Pedobacter sp. TaxID=1411316 RepID=UPI0028098DAA|nr:type II CAAX endopeptidase family protein [Pedobacter sp.]MDQ8006747.1 type II CAAX endopeptidase family protein [Pedobacter sp.]